MMPNDRGRRGAALRGAAVAIVGIALVVLAAQVWSPAASSSASGTPPASSAAVTGPGSAGLTPGPSTAPPSAASIAPPSSSPSPSPSASPATALDTALAATLQSTLDRVRLKLSIPGVSVAILWDDGASWVGASGYRDLAAKDPMTTGTAFALASISKTLTAAVVLELVQEGRLALDQSVAPLLPAFHLDRRITVRMLLDHTSGLPDFFMGKGVDVALQRAPGATWTALRAWSYVPKKHAVPGRAWIYSNTNYLLLGELVTAVTGNPLASEVRRRLLDPLRLDTAWYQAVERSQAPGTVAYAMTRTADKRWRATPVAAPTGVMPFRSVVTAAGGAGSIAATALDAARWMRVWAGGVVLNPAMQAQVLADVARTVKLHAAIPYGLGIQRVTLNGYTALGHSGRYLGIRNVARYLPDAGLTIAVLTNQSVWDPNRIASALLAVILPTPSPSASPGPSGSTPAATASPTPSPS